MKKLLLLFIAVLGLSLAFQNQSFAQTKKKVAVYGKSGTGDKNMSAPSEDQVRPKSKKRNLLFVP